MNRNKPILHTGIHENKAAAVKEKKHEAKEVKREREREKW